MAADPGGRYFYFHATALTPMNTTGSGFGGNDEFGPDIVLVDNILPTEAVAIFFLNSTGNQ